MLLTPFRFTSPISAFGAIGNLPILSDAFTVGHFIGIESAMMFAYGDYQQIIADANTAAQWASILFVIWLAGACVALTYAAVTGILLRCRFKDAVQRPDMTAFIGFKARVYVSSHTAGPLTYGIFRPCIILPLSVDKMDDDSIEYMLVHELQHIRGRDALINLLWILSLCLHWFNPIVWLGWTSLRRDMETKCDANVLKHIGAERRTGYAQTLLDMVPLQRMVFPLAFGSSSAKDRIIGILAYRPATKRAVCAALAMMLFCMALFAANPARIRAEAYFSIAVSIHPDDTGIHLFRVQSQPADSRYGSFQRSVYIHSGAFASFSDAQQFFIENYLVEADIAINNLVPESATRHNFGVSSGPFFTWQGLNISVTTDAETRNYMLMDTSTFMSDDVDLAQAVNALISRTWTSATSQEDCRYRSPHTG